MSLLRSLRVERARQLWQCVLEDASPFRIAHPSVAAVIHSRWCLHGPDWAPDGTAALLVGAARSGAEPPQDAAVALHEAATRLRRESELDSWLAVVGQIRRRPQAAGALEAACSPSAAREALAAELAWQQQHRLVGDELALARELYRGVLRRLECCNGFVCHKGPGVCGKVVIFNLNVLHHAWQAGPVFARWPHPFAQGGLTHTYLARPLSCSLQPTACATPQASTWRWC